MPDFHPGYTLDLFPCSPNEIRLLMHLWPGKRKMSRIFPRCPQGKSTLVAAMAFICLPLFQGLQYCLSRQFVPQHYPDNRDAAGSVALTVRRT